MKYRIFCDLHKFSPRPKSDKPSKIEITYTENDIFCGDLWDTNCKKKDAQTVQDVILEHNRKCKALGIITLKSNHHGIYDAGVPMLVVKDSILFLHGHVFYSKKKMDKWHNKTAGIGKFKYYMILLKNKLTTGFHAPTGEKTLKKLATLARLNGCSTLVAGHFHKSLDKKVDGIRIILCDRGVTEVEI